MISPSLPEAVEQSRQRLKYCSTADEGHSVALDSVGFITYERPMPRWESEPVHPEDGDGGLS